MRETVSKEVFFNQGNRAHFLISFVSCPFLYASYNKLKQLFRVITFVIEGKPQDKREFSTHCDSLCNWLRVFKE